MAKKLFALLLAFPLALFAYTSPGSPIGYVNDFGHMLSSDTIQSLDKKLTEFQKETGSEVTVVTVPSLGGDTIENFANKLFADWGIGNKEKDTGALLLISSGDREARIEVGYGLEPVLTDIESSHIISDILVPAFQQNEYDRGVNDAVDQMVLDVSRSEPLLSNAEPSMAANLPWGNILFFVFFVLAGILGPSKSWWGGGVVGVIAGVIFGVMKGVFLGVIATAVLVPLGLLFDYLVSTKEISDGKGGTKPPFWMGGFGGGGGSGFGGGGFGGFGGGSSGGGGASGKW